jgi:basic membrane lipoprotein Med (substrate-binding protein (PBP1-ABC) superfamily)/DNA-binding SARP family transcriptional activator
VRFEVLGRLRALAPVLAGVDTPSDAREIPLGGPKQRLVLALLLAEPNTTVSVERLIDGVWGETPPDSARHTLQSYVSELRKSLGETIERDTAGYSARVDRDQLDALDFEARVSEARARLDHDPAGAVAELDAALALWRGRPFEDFPDQDALQGDAVRLEELRVVAIESALGARLALGDHSIVAVEIERVIRAHPYREELRALQMLALYRSGRQAEALRSFQVMRSALAEELGIDPSPRLRRLEEQILLQDPDLDPRQPAATSTVHAVVRGENPYMGLRPFRESDAARFFGQERLIADLAARVLSDATFTAVVGPSGSGKSSAVQAGLLPHVRRELPSTRIAMLQPGSQPFAELEAALAGLPGPERPTTVATLRSSSTGLRDAAARVLEGHRARLLLVVDQFEELFTLTDPDEADAFLTALSEAADDPEGRIHVLVTMRADFYDRPLAVPRFGRRFADNVVTVVPMGPDDLEAAATQPARQLDVRIEPRLMARLIADVAGQPNALPLFQYALTELFDERVGSVLDLATYERVGGVRKAVARRAETLYSRLDGPEQEAVRQLFLRIATVSDAVIGRRRVPASELTALDVDIVALQSAIDSFSRYRLLALDRDPTTGAPTVEVAHEALLGEWHRLRDWIDESRDDLATHARFAIAVQEWESAARETGYLLTGARLEDYERWAATSRLKLTITEQTFVQQSVDARDAESVHGLELEAAAARQRRRSRWQLAFLFGATAVLAAVIAYPLLTTAEPPRQIAVALDAPREVGGFNEIIARGLESSAKDHGMEAVILEPPYADLAATEGELATDSDIVFGSFLMWPNMVRAAADHPDTTFVFLDYADPPEIPNGVSVRYAQEEGSYLVGAAAALESTTGRIGYIGANSSPYLIEQFRAGFEQGAKAVRPDIEIVSSLIEPGEEGGYEDAATAGEIAAWMYTAEDVDVIFTAAGGSGQGVIDAATDLSEEVGRHLWAVGVDSDFLFELPVEQREHLLTSMVKRMDVGVERIVDDYVAGDLEVPGALRLGLAEDAVGYSTSGGHLSAETIARLDALAADIKNGEISVSLTPTGELREPAPPPEAPDTPESRAALEVANRWFQALDSDDIDGAMGLMTPRGVGIYVMGSRTPSEYRNVLVWDAEDHPDYVDVQCVARLPGSGLRVDCSYGVQPGMARAVGAPVVRETSELTIVDGAIVSYRRDFIPPDYSIIDTAFDEWMQEHHPDDAAAVECCGGPTLEEARENGVLRARYGAEWAAYLDEKGCGYNDGC